MYLARILYVLNYTMSTTWSDTVIITAVSITENVSYHRFCKCPSASVHVLFVVPVQRRCTRTTFKPIVGGIITQSILGQNLHLRYVQYSIVSIFS